MSKGHHCVQCSADCKKRQILCDKCWEGLAEIRKKVIRRSTYRRDEVGKKFLTNLLTCDLNILNQMIADSNGGILEPERVGKHLRGFENVLEKDVQKKEAEEIV